MTFYGKMAGALCAAAIIGGGAAAVCSQSTAGMSQAEQVISETRCYIIKEHEGRIALFEEGGHTPLAMYSTPLSQINPADAVLLRDGIRLRGITEGERFLDDLDVQ